MKTIESLVIALGVALIIGTVFVSVIAPYLPLLIIAMILGLLIAIVLRR